MLGYIQDFWMGSIGCGYCQYLQVWKLWVVSSIGEVLPNFFLVIEFNYIIIRIKLCRTKSTSRRLHRIAASSSSSEDDMSLGSHQEEAFAPSTNAASSSAVSQRRGEMPSQRNQFTRNTRHGGRTTFQCKFVSVLVFFNYNIIYEQLINISLL
jgi:hypothetical protein